MPPALARAPVQAPTPAPPIRVPSIHPSFDPRRSCPLGAFAFTQHYRLPAALALTLARNTIAVADDVSGGGLALAIIPRHFEGAGFALERVGLSEIFLSTYTSADFRTR